MSSEPPLEDLVDRYYGRIHRAATLLTGCGWEADDLTQETFARVAQSWHRFAGKSDTFTWIYGILVNVDRSRRRRLWRWLKCQTGLMQSAAEYCESQAAPADHDLLWKQVARLPPEQRQAIMMRYGEGWSYARIAEICECKESTARTRVFKALEKLRQQLQPATASIEECVVSLSGRQVSG